VGFHPSCPKPQGNRIGSATVEGHECAAVTGLQEFEVARRHVIQGFARSDQFERSGVRELDVYVINTILMEPSGLDAEAHAVTVPVLGSLKIAHRDG
jgi:hypothetical protein